MQWHTFCHVIDNVGESREWVIEIARSWETIIQVGVGRPVNAGI